MHVTLQGFFFFFCLGERGQGQSQSEKKKNKEKQPQNIDPASLNFTRALKSLPPSTGFIQAQLGQIMA